MRAQPSPESISRPSLAEIGRRGTQTSGPLINDIEKMRQELSRRVMSGGRKTREQVAEITRSYKAERIADLQKRGVWRVISPELKTWLLSDKTFAEASR